MKNYQDYFLQPLGVIIYFYVIMLIEEKLAEKMAYVKGNRVEGAMANRGQATIYKRKCRKN